jgi:hypothetical protein
MPETNSPMKRSTAAAAASSTDDDDNDIRKRSKIGASPLCEYTGYSFQKDTVVVETVDASSIDSTEFFDRFISKRKPCVIRQTTESTKNPMFSLTPQDLVDVAGQEVCFFTSVCPYEADGKDNN